MDYKEFCENFGKMHDSLKEQAVKDIIKKHHLSFVEKTTIASDIAKKSCTNANGEFEISSVTNYYLSNLALIENFTKLEGITDGASRLDAYEKLDECGAFEMILGNIDKKETADLMYAIKMSTEDYIVNHSSFTSGLSDLFAKVSPSLDQMSDVLKTLDNEKVQEMIDAIKNQGFSVVK